MYSNSLFIMAFENKAVMNLLFRTEMMKTVFDDLRSAEIKIPTKIQPRNECGPLHRCKSLPIVAINFRQSIAAAGDANNCSPSAVPVEQQTEELRNSVLHINQLSEETNNAVLSDAEILGLNDRPSSPPKYRKIKLANYAGPQFRRCMDLVDQIVNAPLTDDLEIDTYVPLPALETPAKSSDAQAVQTSKDIVDRWTVRRYSSMPNIHVHFGVTGVDSEQENCDVSREETRQAAGAGDLNVQPKRRKSIWSRTKRLFRRLFCCVA